MHRGIFIPISIYNIDKYLTTPEKSSGARYHETADTERNILTRHADLICYADDYLFLIETKTFQESRNSEMVSFDADLNNRGTKIEWWTAENHNIRQNRESLSVALSWDKYVLAVNESVSCTRTFLRRHFKTGKLPLIQFDSLSDRWRRVKEQVARQVTVELVREARKIVREMDRLLRKRIVAGKNSLHRCRKHQLLILVKDIRAGIRAILSQLFKCFSDFSGCDDDLVAYSIISKPRFFIHNQKKCFVKKRSCWPPFRNVSDLQLLT